MQWWTEVRVPLSDSPEIPYNYKGSRGGKKTYVDLFLFTYSYFCRIRQYNTWRQVMLAIRLPYLLESVHLPICLKVSFEWKIWHQWAFLMGRWWECPLVFIQVSMSQARRHTVSHIGNPAPDYKMSLEWVHIYIRQHSRLPLLTDCSLVLEQRMWERTFWAQY